MQNGDVFFNDCSLTRDESGRVIDKISAADSGSRMDVDCEGFRDEALQIQRQFRTVLLPYIVADAVADQCLKAFEVKEWCEHIRAGRVTLFDCVHVAGDLLQNLGILLKGFHE